MHYFPICMHIFQIFTISKRIQPGTDTESTYDLWTPHKIAVLVSSWDCQNLKNFVLKYRELNGGAQRRYLACSIIHCCKSTTPQWIRLPPSLFYMVPFKECHRYAYNKLGKHLVASEKKHILKDLNKLKQIYSLKLLFSLKIDVQ